MRFKKEFKTQAFFKMNNDAISLLNNLVAGNKTPGLQYLLMQDGKIAIAHVAGMADFEENRPVINSTVFNACSITKTFTSLAVMQLAMQGKIGIDENAATFSAFIPAEKNITVRHLLSHTSGISNPIPLKWIYLQEESFDEAAFMKTIVEKYLKFGSVAGKKFAYSNINYLILGNIIENISGIRYTDFIEQNIIRKLNVPKDCLAFKVSGYTKYATAYQKRFSLLNVMIGFFLDRKKFMESSVNQKWRKFKNYYVSGKAYGGLVANASSLAAFIDTLFKNGSVLLDDSTKEALFTTQIMSGSKPIPMTLGWFTGQLNGIKYFTHAGGGGGYYCEMRHYPATKITSVIMFNRTGTSDERFLDKVDCYFLNSKS